MQNDPGIQQDQTENIITDHQKPQKNEEGNHQSVKVTHHLNRTHLK